MNGYIDTQSLPEYAYSNYRRFEKHEKHVTRHCDEDVLLIVFSGTVRFHEDGVPVQVRAGEYYIQRRGLYQQGVEESDEPFYYYVHFRGEWSTDAGIHCRGTFAPDAVQLAQRLDALRLQGAPRLEMTAAFYQLLLQLRYEQSMPPARRLAEAIRLRLQSAQAGDVSLGALAGELHFSENYLIRVFREIYGQTPHAYLVTLRLGRAAELMRYSDLPLERIALECGFGGYANFFKAYKKAYGVPPSAARGR